MRNSAPAQHPNATQDHSNSSWLLRVYSAVSSWLLRVYSAVSSPVVALWSWVFPSAAVIPQPIFPQYQELAPDIQGSLRINAFLDPKDIAALICSKEQHRLFQPDLDGLKLLRFVVRGKQEKANGLLYKHPELLLKRGTITDYSGRTFKNITAYEYAYWALDTHMCRMLERHMDANTATIMHQRCLDIDKNGLTYEQRGVVIEHSRHFDLTPLKSALQDYVVGYDNWSRTRNWPEGVAAWMAVGMVQRDVPVHVANEYCRRDRSFHPRPAFNEETLPRNLNFYNYNTERVASWFPLVVSASSGLGVDFAVLRGRGRAEAVAVGRVSITARPVVVAGLCALADLAAVSRLDEVRTIDLTQSRENLTLISPELGIGRPGM